MDGQPHAGIEHVQDRVHVVDEALAGSPKQARKDPEERDEVEELAQESDRDLDQVELSVVAARYVVHARAAELDLDAANAGELSPVIDESIAHVDSNTSAGTSLLDGDQLAPIVAAKLDHRLAH